MQLNAGWGAETFLASALEELGHPVIRLDYRAHRAELPQLLARAVEVKPDIVFLQRGEDFPCDLLSQFQTPRVYSATEGAWNHDQHKILQEKIFDAYVASSRNTFDFMIRECQVPAARAHHIPSGYDPNTYKTLAVEKLYNVIAVFNWNFRRRKAFWHLGWGITNKNNGFSGVYGAQCNYLMNQSKVTLNIHATDTLDTETRLYELLPTATAIVSEVCDAPEWFEGAGIQWFPQGDWKMMRKLVHRLLNDDAFRDDCVGKNNALAPYHTWAYRASPFSDLFERLLSEKR